MSISQVDGVLQSIIRYNGTCGVAATADEVTQSNYLESGMLAFHPRNIWNPKYTDTFKNQIASLNIPININSITTSDNQFYMIQVMSPT
jgi:hypothetical protein